MRLIVVALMLFTLGCGASADELERQYTRHKTQDKYDAAAAELPRLETEHERNQRALERVNANSATSNHDPRLKGLEDAVLKAAESSCEVSERALWRQQTKVRDLADQLQHLQH